MHDRMQHDQDAMKASTPTEWEQRRQLVEAIMVNVVRLMEQLDRPPGTLRPRHSYSLRDIFEETELTLDTIRARVAHQAFAGGSPEAFWPPMRALLDSFAPELGMLVCESLEWDPAYEVFWEPEVRELQAWWRAGGNSRQKDRNEGSEGRRRERCPSREETTDE
jgi:hypothetical protein